MRSQGSELLLDVMVPMTWTVLLFGSLVLMRGCGL
jgi:hypothetical protein